MSEPEYVHFTREQLDEAERNALPPLPWELILGLAQLAKAQTESPKGNPEEGYGQ